MGGADSAGPVGPESLENKVGRRAAYAVTVVGGLWAQYGQGQWWVCALGAVLSVVLFVQKGLREDAIRAYAAQAAPGAVLYERRLHTTAQAGPTPKPVAAPKPVITFTPGGGEIRALRFSPQGQLLAVGCADGQVRLWAGTGLWAGTRTGSPVPIATLDHSSPLTALTFASDGRLLVTAGEAGVVRLWDVSEPAHPVLLATTVHTERAEFNTVQDVDLSPDTHLLATAGADGAVVLWDVSDSARPTQAARLAIVGPRHSEGGVRTVRFSHDGQLLAAGGRLGYRGPVQLWGITDPGRPRVIGRLKPNKIDRWHGDQLVCHALAFSPRAPLLVTASGYDHMHLSSSAEPPPTPSDYVRMHDSAAVLWSLRAPTRPLGLVTLKERGGDGTAGVTATMLAGHAETVRCLAINADQTRLATGAGAERGNVLLWDITRPARTTHVHTLSNKGSLRAMTFSPDGQFLACANNSEQVTVWAIS
ncbi:MAG TPA: hypothetical protein VFP72_05210 [Kineosporiaceae bacterium]|nr:hypothetical protein [Kineosporiaceae bacterium]